MKLKPPPPALSPTEAPDELNRRGITPETLPPETGIGESTISTARRYDLEMLWSLRRIIHAFDVHSKRLSATADVTLSQLVCLIAIVAEEGIAAQEISARIHVSASTLVGVLERLESKGFIQRTRDPGDRRRLLVVPTERGRQLIADVPSPLGEKFDLSFSRLPEANKRRLARSLTQVADLL